MLTELHQEHSKLQHDIDHLQAILTQATKHSIFVLGLPEELWDYQILPFFDIVEVTTQFRLTSQNLFGKYWNLFVASNQIRVPQDIRDINNLTSVVALLKQQRQYTIAQPLVVTLSSKIKHTIDYRSIPIESCMTVTGDGATCESTIVANGGFHLVGNNVKIQNLSLIGDGTCEHSNYAGIFGCQSFAIENVSVQNYMHGIVVEVDRDVCTCDYHSFCDGESCNERSLPGIETPVLESEIQQALSLTPAQLAGLQPESLKEYMTAIRSSSSSIPISEPVTLVNEDDDSEDDEDFDPSAILESDSGDDEDFDPTGLGEDDEGEGEDGDFDPATAFGDEDDAALVEDASVDLKRSRDDAMDKSNESVEEEHNTKRHKSNLMALMSGDFDDDDDDDDDDFDANGEEEDDEEEDEAALEAEVE